MRDSQTKNLSFTFFWKAGGTSREKPAPLFSCSKYVAERMIRHIPAPDNDKPHVYLEVGPETGVVTDLFIKKLGANDTLHVVEIEENFYNYMKEKFKGDPRVIVHHKDITEWSLQDEAGHDVQFDAIATGIPLNNLPNKSILKSILAAYERLIKPGKEITSVEYVLTGTIGQLFRGKEFQELYKEKCDFYRKYASEPSAIVWSNFPLPARVHRLIFPKNEKEKTA